MTRNELLRVIGDVLEYIEAREMPADGASRVPDCRLRELLHAARAAEDWDTARVIQELFTHRAFEDAWRAKARAPDTRRAQKAARLRLRSALASLRALGPVPDREDLE